MTKFSKSVFYICEGECESNLLKEMKNIKNESIKISGGKIKVFNVLKDKKIASIAPYLDNKKDTIIIFDCDDYIKNGIQSLLKNIKEMKKRSRNVYVVLQVNNFEEELTRSFSNCSLDKLYKLFQSESKSEFKNNFCKTRNTLNVLQKHEFAVDNFCNKKNHPNEIRILVNTLEDLNVQVLSFHELLL